MSKKQMHGTNLFKIEKEWKKKKVSKVMNVYKMAKMDQTMKEVKKLLKEKNSWVRKMKTKNR